jgi:hypothetical protein
MTSSADAEDLMPSTLWITLAQESLVVVKSVKRHCSTQFSFPDMMQGQVGLQSSGVRRTSPKALAQCVLA